MLEPKLFLRSRHTPCLYIAAKAPRAGLVKTRLGRSIGCSRAVSLYRAFLQDLARHFIGAPFEVGWYVTPGDAWKDLAPLVNWAGRATRVIVQPDGDWGRRQCELFREAETRGEGPVILIASDSPQVSIASVVSAFSALKHHDLVFGPVYDGGYYLVGMRRWHDLLDGVPMSTSSVLETIIARAKRCGCSVAQLEKSFDVDEAEDLQYLRQLPDLPRELPYTYAALTALGLLTQPGRP